MRPCWEFIRARNHPCTCEEWERLPKTELTSETEWKPSCLDGGISDVEKWAETLQILQDDERWDMKNHPFDDMGYHLDRLNKPKDGVTVQRRIFEDANKRYSYELDRAQALVGEVTEHHAENRGEPAHEIPMDTNRTDDFHGGFFLSEASEQENPFSYPKIPEDDDIDQCYVLREKHYCSLFESKSQSQIHCHHVVRSYDPRTITNHG